MEPTEVALADSFVLEVAATGTRVCLLIDAALRREHPLFYWPPRAGEANAYAQLWWCLEGDVVWVEGPRPPGPAGADGVPDYGSIYEYGQTDGDWYVIGDFGHVVVENATSTIESRPST